MTTNNKSKRTSSPLIKKILAEASPVQRIQNKNRVALACRIDDLIKTKGYTYSSFANKIGKQPSEITKWLSGSHNFTMNTLDEIAYHLTVSTAFLMQPQPEKVIYKHKIIVVTEIIEAAPPYYQGNYGLNYLNNSMGGSLAKSQHFYLKTSNS
jgi:transcriptional regulator with XRE-family HTH domain